jgi:hypothetical protein
MDERLIKRILAESLEGRREGKMSFTNNIHLKIVISVILAVFSHLGSPYGFGVHCRNRLQLVRLRRHDQVMRMLKENSYCFAVALKGFYLSHADFCVLLIPFSIVALVIDLFASAGFLEN